LHVPVRLLAYVSPYPFSLHLLLGTHSSALPPTAQGGS